MSQSFRCAVTQEIVPHRMLSVPDILHEICEQIVVMEYDGGRSKTLFSLVLCCKSISEIALDSLWRRMYTTMPLLRLFSGLDNVDGVMVLRGKIGDELNHGFRGYARRVQELSFSLSDIKGFNGVGLHPSVYVWLAQLEKPFLPSLRRLECAIDTPFTSQILPFLSSTISVFSLRSAEKGEYEDHHTEVTLNVLCKESPGLRDLSLCIPVPSHAISSITSFTQLHSLTFRLSNTRPSSAGHVIRRLSVLDNLAKLDITFPDFSAIPASAQHSDIVAGPPALEELIVKGRMPQIAELLNLVVRGRLKSVTLHDIVERGKIKLLTFQLVVSQWREHVDMIVSRFSQSLRELTLRWQGEDSTPSSDRIRLFSVLEPLLNIRQLKYLDCSQFPCLALSDDEFKIMANAWPEIGDLHLPPSSSPMQPTISSLKSLAHHCSGLKHLTLTVNTRDLLADTSAPQKSHHGLSSLTLGQSLIGDPIIVARHLDRLFPSLESLRAVGGDANGWAQVYRMIRDIAQPARRDEREGVCSSAKCSTCSLSFSG